MFRWTSAGLLAGTMAAASAAAAQTAPTPATPATPGPDVYLAAPATAASRLQGPQGWLGIHYICDIESWTKGREMFVRHNGYPLIASVEPGSPADKAGIQAGDTILAYNDDDVNGRTLSLTKLLRPGNRINVRIRRARQTLDIPVTVGRRTMYVAETVPTTGYRFEVDPSGIQRIVVTTPNARVRVPPVYVTTDPTVIPAPPVIAATPAAPAPPVPMFWTRTTSALAGAELARVTEDLGEAFGVSRGVLVLSVGPNTPAAHAGLRGGDVITRVDDTEIGSPAQIQRALQRASDVQQVKLTVVRKKKEMVVPLRW